MNPALCSSGFLGILGLCRFYEGLMLNYVVDSKKCIVPVFFDGEPQNWCRGSSFSGGISENGEPDSGFALLGVSLRQMIAIEIILHTVYSKNTGIYSGFCMCHKLKDEDEDTNVINPLEVGPGGGVTIYIYIRIYLRGERKPAMSARVPFSASSNKKKHRIDHCFLTVRHQPTGGQNHLFQQQGSKNIAYSNVLLKSATSPC